MPTRNLIRFDWALKRLLRNKANFSILEGFLSELLREQITIESILESESNQRTDTDKFKRVDILVKDSKGELVVIEIQNQNEYDYFQRMAYGVSKVITEFISVGEPYKNVQKVYSVNIVYFDLGHGLDYVYHGKTDFIGIHKADKLELSPKQKEALGKTEPSQIFPEYYVIKVNQFDGVAKDTLDEWIYYLKNNEIKENFKAQGIHIARELLRVDNLPEDERISYNRHMEDLRYGASMAWTMKIEAQETEEIAKKEERLRIARNLSKLGVGIDMIIDATGLTKEEIEQL